jgi:hypothetical protein
VEFNARFTAGLVALAQVRRHLPELKSELGLAPGSPRRFAVALAAPANGWPASRAGDCWVRALPGAGGITPGLVATREADPLPPPAPVADPLPPPAHD